MNATTNNLDLIEKLEVRLVEADNRVTELMDLIEYVETHENLTIRQRLKIKRILERL